MIQSKKDLKEYFHADLMANKFDRMPMRWMNARYNFLRYLRLYEYAINTKMPPPRRLFYRYKLYHLSVKTGIQIPPNTFGKGLYLPHHGTIVVNETARFGDNCVVQAGVNISENVRGGDHVYLSAGCKIMKNVTISSHIIVGANAVVTKTFNEENVVVAGVPAKIISTEGFKKRGRAI